MEYQLTKLAAIDIGSNAVRCQISAVLFYNGRYRLKRVEYVRYPLRLGEDVFATGEIPPAKADKFVKFLHSLKLLMEVHEVSHHLICATSAMRTAANGAAVAERVRQELDLNIQVIDGQAEASYINRVIEHLLEDNRHYLHIDVGGGSTEFNIYHNRHKVAAQSFEIGSIRRMQQEQKGGTVEEMNGLWQRMEEWVRENARRYHVTRAIGTGGNIGKLYSMTPAANGHKPATRRSLHALLERLGGLSMSERVNVAMLNPDRADVIVPAGHIYLSAMEWANVSSMIVPDIGLKDGLLQALFEQYFSELNPNEHPRILPVPDVENGVVA
jgi:exopolyphosphatase/guanosine-5'-triphosphate,3'-diphosphate pyrophosphatase